MRAVPTDVPKDLPRNAIPRYLRRLGLPNRGDFADDPGLGGSTRRDPNNEGLSTMEWRPYVPVAKRRARARREMNKLRKKGRDIQPIEIEGRTIARSFWGKRWCEHLESFSDYANRLPRGRTYVRNGSVCHLAIRPGRIDAIVSGSELYDVTIRIDKLKAAVWKSIKTRCSGQIGSMLELLQGKLSRQVMGVVTDRARGLFPKPGEIRFDCTCPDWATMCKHVASVLYGVGSRLDDRPESLFLLRGVDTAELIATEMALPGDTSTDDALADDALAGIFGIDLDAGIDSGIDPGDVSPTSSKAPTGSRKQARRRAAPAGTPRTPPVAKTRDVSATGTSAGRASAGRTRKAATSAASRRDTRPTGKWVARLRRRHGLSVARFAGLLGVSAVTVYRWEAAPGRLNLQARPLKALMALYRKSGERAR